MFLIVIVLSSILVGLLRRGSFANLSGGVKAPYLYILSILIFIGLRFGLAGQVELVVRFAYGLRLLAYLLLIGGIFANLVTVDLWLLSLLLGTLLNFMVVFANSGYMPVSEAALRLAGIEASVLAESTSMTLAGVGTSFAFLGAIIPLPLPWGMAQVISVGTLFVGFGLFGMIQNVLLGVKYVYTEPMEELDDESPQNELLENTASRKTIGEIFGKKGADWERELLEGLPEGDELDEEAFASSINLAAGELDAAETLLPEPPAEEDISAEAGQAESEPKEDSSDSAPAEEDKPIYKPIIEVVKVEPYIEETEEASIDAPAVSALDALEPIVPELGDISSGTTADENAEELSFIPLEPTAAPEEIVEPVAEVEEVIEPLAEIEEVTEPVAEVEEVTEPVAEVEEATEPVAEVEEATEPVAEVEEVTEPVAEVEEVTEPVADVEKITEEPLSEADFDAVDALVPEEIEAFDSEQPERAEINLDDESDGVDFVLNFDESKYIAPSEYIDNDVDEALGELVQEFEDERTDDVEAVVERALLLDTDEEPTRSIHDSRPSSYFTEAADFSGQVNSSAADVLCGQVISPLPAPTEAPSESEIAAENAPEVSDLPPEEEVLPPTEVPEAEEVIFEEPDEAEEVVAAPESEPSEEITENEADEDTEAAEPEAEETFNAVEEAEEAEIDELSTEEPADDAQEVLRALEPEIDSEELADEVAFIVRGIEQNEFDEDAIGEEDTAVKAEAFFTQLEQTEAAEEEPPEAAEKPQEAQSEPSIAAERIAESNAEAEPEPSESSEIILPEPTESPEINKPIEPPAPKTTNADIQRRRHSDPAEQEAAAKRREAANINKYKPVKELDGSDIQNIVNEMKISEKRPKKDNSIVLRPRSGPSNVLIFSERNENFAHSEEFFGSESSEAQLDEETLSGNQFIVVDGRIVQNPRYKFRRNYETRFSVSAGGGTMSDMIRSGEYMKISRRDGDEEKDK